MQNKEPENLLNILWWIFFFDQKFIIAIYLQSLKVFLFLFIM